MTKFNDTLRVRGSAVGVDDTYLDVSIEDWALDETLKVVEVGGERSWEVPTDLVLDLYDDNNLVPLSGVANPESPVWDLVGRIEEAANNAEMSPVQGDLQNMADEAFKLTVKAQKQSSG